MSIQMANNQMRLVHLDLKGAPPKLSYYGEIFPLLKKWGATGLLIEYEDMFPYWGELKELAAPNAYRPDEIQELLQLAAAHDFIVIPLVQTFGHFEFVLKHEKFHSLREVPDYPLTLCPMNPDSLIVVQKMIDQVMELHPGIQWFHIGADEVFHIGVCKKCHKQIEVYGSSKPSMFFEHITKVLQHIKTRHPDKQAIMWDDMFRDLDLNTIKDSGIKDLVEPMVWYYQKTFYLPEDLWDKYSKVFDGVWAATAFKGATGPCMYITDAAYHLENHRGWIHLMQHHYKKFKHFRGYCLTGWQRYDHYSVLCELLPVGFPSLGLCLLTLKTGSFTEEVHKTVSIDLGFSEPLPLNPFQSVGIIPQCSFPGDQVYIGAQVLLCTKADYKLFLKNERLGGWMTDYHIKHNYTNPAHVKHFLPQGKQLQERLTGLQSHMLLALREIFYDDAVDEWLEVNVNPKVNKIASIVQSAEQQIKIGARVKDYGVKVKSEDSPMT